LGGRSATAGASVGQSLLTSGINAAKTTQAGQFNPLATGLMGAGSNPYLGYAASKYFGQPTTPVTTGDTSAFDYAYGGGGWY
jgi:hypothetical protein